MTEANPCPICGYQIDRVERINTENARLRALNKEMFEALRLMTTWMPSGFAPASKADAMQKADAAMGKYRSHEQQELRK